MRSFIECNVKTFISFIRDNFVGAALMKTIADKKVNPIKDLEETYKGLGHDPASARARLEDQVEGLKNQSEGRVRDIMGTIGELRVTSAQKKELIDAAIHGQSRAVSEPITTFWKTVEQSNRAADFIGRQLEKDGKVLTDETVIPEYVLENAIDSWLTIPQHRIRGTAAAFDYSIKDFLGYEGIAGRAGKDTPEIVEKAAVLVEKDMRGGKALIDHMITEGGAKNEAIARDRINVALAKGADPEGDKVLNLIANSYQNLRKKYHTEMSKLDETYKMDDDFSDRPSHHRVAADIEEFRAFAQKHFDRGAFVGITGLKSKGLDQHMTDVVEGLFNKELDDFIKRMVANESFTAETGFRQIEKVLDKNNILIKDIDKRAEFARLFTDQYGGPLNHSLSSMKSRIKQATFAATGHAHPNRLLGDLRFFLKETQKVHSDVVDRVLAKTESKIKDLIGTSSHLSPTAQNWSRGANNLLSTVTGASALRNWYDYAVHSAMVKALVAEGEAPLTRFSMFAGAIYKNTKELATLTAGAAKDTFGSSVKYRQRGQSRALKLAKFWEQQGAYIQISRATINRGFSDAMEGSRFREDSGAASKTFSNLAEKSQEMVNDFGFADATNIAGRAMHTNQVGGMLFEALGSEFKVAHKQLGKKLDRYGIGEAEWKVLQRLEDIGADEFGVNISKRLEYTPKQLEELIPEIGDSELGRLVLKAGKPIENEAKHVIFRRIIGSYQNMMHAAIDELATTPGVRGTTFEGASSNSLIKALYDMSIGKFLNITFSQWYQLYRSILDAIGLNPNLAGSYDLGIISKLYRDPKLIGLMGGAFAAQMGAGYIYMWMKDLAAGSAPRDPSWQMAREAMVSNGFAGVWGAMLGNLQYGDVPFGTPATAFIKPIRKGISALGDGNTRRLGEAGFDLGKRVAAPLDVWYMRGVYDKLIKRQFIPLNKRQKAYRKKRGQDKNAARWMQGVFE